jgi:hypothetical protein
MDSRRGPSCAWRDWVSQLFFRNIEVVDLQAFRSLGKLPNAGSHDRETLSGRRTVRAKRSLRTRRAASRSGSDPATGVPAEADAARWVVYELGRLALAENEAG